MNRSLRALLVLCVTLLLVACADTPRKKRRPRKKSPATARKKNPNKAGNTIVMRGEGSETAPRAEEKPDEDRVAELLARAKLEEKASRDREPAPGEEPEADPPVEDAPPEEDDPPEEEDVPAPNSRIKVEAGDLGAWSLSGGKVLRGAVKWTVQGTLRATGRRSWREVKLSVYWVLGEGERSRSTRCTLFNVGRGETVKFEALGPPGNLVVEGVKISFDSGREGRKLERVPVKVRVKALIVPFKLLGCKVWIEGGETVVYEVRVKNLGDDDYARFPLGVEIRGPNGEEVGGATLWFYNVPVGAEGRQVGRMPLREGSAVHVDLRLIERLATIEDE